MFRDYRTRKQRLSDSIKEVLTNKDPQPGAILKAVDEYETDNLKTIKKLKRKKTATMNKINGAIRQSIDAHPVITKELTGSIGKRVYGAILDLEEEEKKKISMRDILIGLVIGVIITILVV